MECSPTESREFFGEGLFPPRSCKYGSIRRKILLTSRIVTRLQTIHGVFGRTHGGPGRLGLISFDCALQMQMSSRGDWTPGITRESSRYRRFENAGIQRLAEHRAWRDSNVHQMAARRRHERCVYV